MYSYQQRNRNSKLKKIFGIAFTATSAAIYLSDKQNRFKFVENAVKFTSSLARSLERGITEGNIKHISNSMFDVNGDYSGVDLSHTRIGKFITNYSTLVNHSIPRQSNRDSVFEYLIQHKDWKIGAEDTRNLLAYTGNHMDLIHTRGSLRGVNRSASHPLYRSLSSKLNAEHLDLLSQALKQHNRSGVTSDKNATKLASIFTEQLHERYTAGSFERGILGNLFEKIPGIGRIRFFKEQTLKAKVTDKQTGKKVPYFENKVYEALGIRPVNLVSIVGKDFHFKLLKGVRDVSKLSLGNAEFAKELENHLTEVHGELNTNEKIVTRIAAALHISNSLGITDDGSNLSNFHSGIMRTKKLGFNVDAISDVLSATKGFIYSHSNINFGRPNYAQELAGILGGGQLKGHVTDFIKNVIKGNYHATETELDYDHNGNFRSRNVRTVKQGSERYNDNTFTQSAYHFHKLVEKSNEKSDYYYLGNRVLGSFSENGERELVELPARFQILDTRYGFKKRYKEITNADSIDVNPIRHWFGDTAVGRLMDAFHIGYQKDENSFVRRTSWAQREMFPNEGVYAKDPFNAYKKIMQGSTELNDVNVLLDGLLKSTSISPNLDVRKLFEGVDLSNLTRDPNLPTMFNLLNSGLDEEGRLKTSELFKATDELGKAIRGESLENPTYFGKGSSAGLQSKGFGTYGMGFQSNPYYTYLRGRNLVRPENVVPTERFLGTETLQFGADELKSRFLSEMVQQVFKDIDYKVNPESLEIAKNNISKMLSNISGMDGISKKDSTDTVSHIWATWMSKNLHSNFSERESISKVISESLSGGSGNVKDHIASTISRIFGSGKQSLPYDEIEAGMELYAIPSFLPTKIKNIDETLGQRLYDWAENTPNAAYRLGYKTNEVLGKAGLGLPDVDMATTSELYTNLVVKRALPFGAAYAAYNVSSNILNTVGLPGPRDVLSNLKAYASLTGSIATDYTGTTGILKKLTSNIPGMGMIYYPRSIDEQQERIAREYKSRRYRKKLFGSKRGGGEPSEIESVVNTTQDHKDLKRDNLIGKSMLDFMGSFLHPHKNDYQLNKSTMGMNIQLNPKNTKDFFKRNYSFMKNSHPIKAAFIGGILGSFIGKTRYTKPFFAAAGASLSFGLSVGSIIGRHIDKYTDYQKTSDIERYYDMLKYVKNKRLAEFYSKKSKKEDGFDIREVIGEINPLNKNKRKPVEGSYYLGHLASKALIYEKRAEETLTSMSMDDEVHPLKDILNAVPEYERAGLANVVVNGSNRDKRRAYNNLDPTKKRVLGRYLGVSKKQLPKKESLREFFNDYQLPGISWAGWGEDFDLEDARTITARQSHANMGMMHIHPGSVKEAYRHTKNAPIPVVHAHTAHIKKQLHDVLSAHGMNNADINLSLVPTTGKSTSNISLNLEESREDEIVSRYR